MPLGYTGCYWDDSVEGMRMQRVRGADIVFNKVDFPASVRQTNTIAAYQSWLDSSLQTTLRGPPYNFTGFIKAKMLTLSPFKFVFLVTATQAEMDATLNPFPDPSPPVTGPPPPLPPPI